MDRFRAEFETLCPALLRDMARYFAVFQPGPKNLYIELVRMLGGASHRPIFATTNYDLLIEYAINVCRIQAAYEPFEGPQDQIAVIKIHGSCNFLPNLNAALRGISVTGFGAIAQAPVRTARSTAEIISFCDREDTLAPALALYSPDKRVLFSPNFVDAQKEYWRKALDVAERICVVGLKVHPSDTHIWGPLANSTAPLFYAGGEPAEFERWVRAENRSDAHFAGKTFQDAMSTIARRF
jgi:hypothetical protein